MTSSEQVTRHVFGSAELEHRILTAPRVTATRMHLRRELMARTVPPEKRVRADDLSSYRMDKPVSLNGSQMARVRKLLSSPKSYVDPRAVTYCIPDFGVLLTFHPDSGTPIRIPLCFECDLLDIYDGQEHVARRVEFDGMHRPLLKLCRELFPDDPGLRQL